MVGVIVGCAVLIDGRAVVRIVGETVIGVAVGCTVAIDGLVVGRVLGATVFGAIVGKAVGIGVVGIISIVLITLSIARLVKLHSRFIYIDSSSFNISSPTLLPTDTTERWALSPTQHVLLSEIVSMNSKREQKQASVLKFDCKSEGR
jgi:hypothetical protein